MVLMGFPVSLADGPVLAYNATVLISYVLSGFGVYVWVRRLTRSWAPGVVAGVSFAFASYRMMHAYGHLNLMGTQWFPFYFMALGHALDSSAHRWRNSFLVALFLALIGGSSQYYLYMTLVLSAVYLLAWLLLQRPRRGSLPRTAGNLVRIGSLAVPAAFVSVAPYLQLAGRSGMPSRSFDEVRTWSASPTDFLIPSPFHAIWGNWVATHFDKRLMIENTLYLGTVALALAIVALVGARKLNLGRQVKLLFVMALAACVLALGTDLHWLGQTVVVRVPQWLQKWHPYTETFIPLPGYFLFKYLPFYSSCASGCATEFW